MNMKSSGIGWGATQQYSNYNGSTISVPVGCTVIVTKGQYSQSKPTVKFNGTFALLSLDYSGSNPYSMVGSSLPLHLISSDYSEEDYYYVFGGTFIRLS